MANQIDVQINFFGPFLEEKDISKIMNPKFNSTIYEHQASLLEWFFWDFPIDCLTEEMLKRYVEATPKDIHVTVVPHSDEIYNRLLTPLKCAKRDYCLGDYLSVISLCGVVAEMLALLIWKINDKHVQGNVVDESKEGLLFGKGFENQGQHYRVRILKVFDLINEKQFENFNLTRGTRRKYMHFWDCSSNTEKDDAYRVLIETFRLFKEITGIGINKGRVKIDPLLLKFLEDVRG